MDYVNSTTCHSFDLRPEAAEDVAFLEALFMAWKEPELRLAGLAPDMQAMLLEQQWRIHSTATARTFPNAERLVIVVDGESMGRLMLDWQDNCVNVCDISLMPAWHGRGIGGAVLAEVKQRAAAKGVAVTLQVSRHNPALRLYQRLGFVVTDDSGAQLAMACVRRGGSLAQPHFL